MQKVLILDPDCTGLIGHLFATTKSLLDELEGAKRFVAVNRDVSPKLDFGEDIEVWKWPRLHTVADGFARPFRRSSHLRALPQVRNLQAMVQLVKLAQLRVGDAIIAHSVALRHVAGLASLARVLGREGPRLHLRIIEGGARARLTIEEQANLKTLADIARQYPIVHIYTETFELGAELETSFHFPRIKQWLIPMNFRGLDDLCDKSDLRDGFVVGLLGGKRDEQGASLIPELIRLLSLRQRGSGLGRIRILFQKPAGLTSTGSLRNNAELLMKSVVELSQSSELDLEFLDPELTPLKFKQAICRSHVLLLPYDVPRYGLRGSGLVIEAALSGTPVVVTKGFAMRNWQELSGAPTPCSLVGYVDALIEVGRDYRRSREGAIAAGRAMRRLMDERIAEIRGDLATSL